MLAHLPSAPAGPTKEVVFFGTPEVAAEVLEYLLSAGVEVAAVVSRPDKRRGRGSSLVASPVKEVALRNGLLVCESADEIITHLQSRPTLEGLTGVVVAYGRIIKEPLLSLIPLVNLHFSLLPRWRGAAPVERAILAGDTHTGSSIMQIEEGLDTGAVFDVVKTPIDEHETCDELRSRLGKLGAEQLVRLLTQGFPVGTVQSGDATHAAKISPEELHLNWQQSAIEVSRIVRVGGAYGTFRGQRLKVLQGVSVVSENQSGDAPGVIVGISSEGVDIATGDGVYRIARLQGEGKKPMAARDWANGMHVSVGEQLG